MMLFATWGRSIHPDRLLFVEAVVRHLLGPQNLTRIVRDPICGEIFVLCKTGQEVDILYRYNVSVDRDAVIFATVCWRFLSTTSYRKLNFKKEKTNMFYMHVLLLLI
jgi:hypothetical protein